MEALLILIIVIVIIFFVTSSRIKSIPEDERTIEEKRFLNAGKEILIAEQNLKDTVEIGYNRVKKATQKKITEQYLVGGNWYLDNNELNVIYTFRSGGNILITEQGIVKKGNYEFIVDNNSIIITLDGISKMFHIENIKNDIFILKDLSNYSTLTFYNQTKIKDNIIKEIKREENLQEKVNFQRPKDFYAELNEQLNSPLSLALEAQQTQNTRISYQISNNSNGLFGVINDLKSEGKDNNQILEDFEKWKSGRSDLTLLDYIYHLDAQRKQI